MWRGSREPSSVFRSPPFPNSTKRGSGPLGPPGLRRPAALGGGARRRRQAQRAGRGRGAGGAAPLRPASGRASAGAGLGAGPRRGGRAASPAVRSARNRGAGGCEAGGRTGPRERAAGRLGLAPGAGQLQRRRGRAGGAGPDRAAAAAAAAIGAARSGRRPGAGSGRRAPGGRRGAARREDDRGLRRAPRAALALRRAPGKLPPGVPAVRKPRAPRGRPRSRRGAHSPGGALPGASAASTAASRGSRAPRSRPRSAGTGSRRGSGEPWCEAGWDVGGWRAQRALPEAGPAKHPSAAPGPRPLLGARLSRAWAGCPLAEPARPPSPGSREPPELASPARAGTAGGRAGDSRQGTRGAGDNLSGRPARGPGLAARRRLRARLPGADRDLG